MTALIVIGVILLILLLILVPRVRLDLCAGEELSVAVRFWGIFRIQLLPKKQRMPSLSRFRAKKVRKREQKQRLKQAKKDAKAAKKAAEKAKRKQTKEEKSTKTSLSEQIRTIAEIVKTVLPKLGRALRIDLSHIVIRVASPDAARTALLYGAISQSVSYLLALLDKITNVKTNRDTVVDVRADFLSEKMTADVRLTVSVSPLSVLGIAFSALTTFLRTKLQKPSDR